MHPSFFALTVFLLGLLLPQTSIAWPDADWWKSELLLADAKTTPSWVKLNNSITNNVVTVKNSNQSSSLLTNKSGGKSSFKSNVVQLQLGTTVKPRKWAPILEPSAQTPKKFWEGKAFEALLEENQKDGLDNIKPFRQSFKSWEYVKEGDKPGKLVERTWEDTNGNVLTSTQKSIETGGSQKKRASWSRSVSQKQVSQVRWDDKIEFTAPPKPEKVSSLKDSNKFEKNPKVLLKKTVRTEDIPVEVIRGTARNPDSIMLVRKNGWADKPKATAKQVQENKPQAQVQPKNEVETTTSKKNVMWFKLSAPKSQPKSSPQVDYTVENVQTLRKKKSSNLSQKQVSINRRTDEVERQSDAGEIKGRKSEKQQALPGSSGPKVSYRFQWLKREDNPSDIEINDDKIEKSEPMKLQATTEGTAVEEEELNDAELDELKRLEEIDEKWEGLSRRNFRNVEEDRVPPEEPKTTEQPVYRNSRANNAVRRNAKQRKAKQIINYTTSVKHNKERSFERLQDLTTMTTPPPTTTATVRFQRKSDFPPLTYPTEPPTTEQTYKLPEPKSNRRGELQQPPVTRSYSNYEVEVEDEPVQPRGRQAAREEEATVGRLEDSIPGTPDQDYPVLDAVPRTNFKCSDHTHPGYYADLETKCQVFHICQSDGRKNSFLCPVGTIFNQKLFVCDWWNNVNCEENSNFYELNSNIYDPTREADNVRSTRNSETTLAPNSVEEEEASASFKVEPIYSARQTAQEKIYFEEEPSQVLQSWQTRKPTKRKRASKGKARKAA